MAFKKYILSSGVPKGSWDMKSVYSWRLCWPKSRILSLFPWSGYDINQGTPAPLRSSVYSGLFPNQSSLGFVTQIFLFPRIACLKGSIWFPGNVRGSQWRHLLFHKHSGFPLSFQQNNFKPMFSKICWVPWIPRDKLWMNVRGDFCK